jgi:flavin reductase (DIM6/NTAB) family NADH-FMN oxidoreductase RutF
MDTLATPESRARLGSALGKIASGLYIVTARVKGEPLGMLCSFVEQASFEPPMITMAIGEGRPMAAALAPGGVFGLHVLGKGNNALMKSFARGSSPEAFAGHPMVENGHGVPQFSEASTFLIARVQQQYAAGDHVLHLAQVLEGQLQNEGDEPMVRVRGNGFKY